MCIRDRTTAIQIAKKRSDLTITIVSKTNKEESNTRYAQGGIAAVWDRIKDDFQKHILDTMDAGDDLSNESIVKLVVEEGPQRVQELIDCCLLYTSPSPRDRTRSRMPSSA